MSRQASRLDQVEKARPKESNLIISDVEITLGSLGLFGGSNEITEGAQAEGTLR